jgi:tetratricopeptide (TPR) repeat protein
MVSAHNDTNSLKDRRVAFVGRLAGMSRRDAQQLLRERSAVCCERLDATVEVVVVGEGQYPLGADDELATQLDAAANNPDRTWPLEVISETELWQRLDLVDEASNVRRLYTPAMLADLLEVPVAVVRRWHRRGLIVPAREVRRLPYFDFQEIATARRLAEMLAAGSSPAAIEKKLAALGRWLPDVDRPLSQLSVIVEGKHLLLRQGEGLVEPGGQFRFDFDAPSDENNSENDGESHDEVDPAAPTDADSSTILAMPAPDDPPLAAMTPEEMCDEAVRLEDDGQLETAADVYRAILVAEGPTAQVCFLLAELLYRIGDVSAARERYSMAVELDEDFVEARANLGCVLAETGRLELAVAAFHGALAYHDEYPDVHYHLARALDELDRAGEAEMHWRAFRALAPDSPWAEQAEARLQDVEAK